MYHYEFEKDGHERASWRFVGECGLDDKGNHQTDLEEYVFWLGLAANLLRHVFGGAPGDGVLGVLWANAPHGPGKFPIIAVGFDQDSEEIMAYVDRLERALPLIDKAIDWPSISREHIKRNLNASDGMRNYLGLN